MRKNVASQVVGAQLNSKTDGTAVTSGTTTVSYTGDGGSYTTGSVGSGSATHKGGGYWEYAPSQGETNFDHVAFTFVNTSAVTASVQIYTSFPQTGDNFARLGAPAGASVSADVAAVKTDTAAVKVQTDKLAFTVTNQVDSNVIDWKSATAPAMTGDAFARLGAPAGASVSADVAATKALLPTALVGGKMDSHVNDIAAGAITATSIAADAITDAKVASDVTIASVTGAVGSVTGAVGSVAGAVGSVTGNVGGNVVGSVASVTARVTANTDQLAGQTVTAAAGVTFPTSVASPTNITAGTITTATNLTNAPTAGDFTATMKTSLNAATPASIVGAVGSVTGNVGGNVTGSVGSVVGAVGSVTGLTASDVGTIKAKTDNLPNDPADASDIAAAFGTTASAIAALPQDKNGYRLSSTGVNDVLRTAMTEGYAADGAAFTLEQAMFMVWSLLAERNLTGTTLQAKKLDGSTNSMAFTLDSGTTPTTQTRSA